MIHHLIYEKKMLCFCLPAIAVFLLFFFFFFVRISADLNATRRNCTFWRNMNFPVSYEFIRNFSSCHSIIIHIVWWPLFLYCAYLNLVLILLCLDDEYFCCYYVILLIYMLHDLRYVRHISLLYISASNKEQYKLALKTSLESGEGTVMFGICSRNNSKNSCLFVYMGVLETWSNSQGTVN